MLRNTYTLICIHIFISMNINIYECPNNIYVGKYMHMLTHTYA